jgi:hypothetical protein
MGRCIVMRGAWMPSGGWATHGCALPTNETLRGLAYLPYRFQSLHCWVSSRQLEPFDLAAQFGEIVVSDLHWVREMLKVSV